MESVIAGTERNKGPAQAPPASVDRAGSLNAGSLPYFTHSLIETRHWTSLCTCLQNLFRLLVISTSETSFHRVFVWNFFLLLCCSPINGPAPRAARPATGPRWPEPEGYRRGGRTCARAGSCPTECAARLAERRDLLFRQQVHPRGRWCAAPLPEHGIIGATPASSCSLVQRISATCLHTSIQQQFVAHHTT